ncbi:MAG: hypothetical protein ACJ748_11055 [Flavisolibacter sp.]
MGISISTDSWLLNLFKNTRERDAKIADYLDQTADEAMSLARIWENVIQSIIANGTADADTDTVWIRLVERPEWTIYSKNIPKSRLEIFFERLSSVLGKHRGDTDFVICRIGIILQKRKLDQEMIEDELKKIKEARFFDKSNQIHREISLQESIPLVNREAAALFSFAKEFRTKI